MTYATANPPQLITRGVSGGALWLYTDADAHGDVDASDYFDNGSDLGMKVNDAIIVVDTATPSCTIHVVTVVTAGGAATISAATLS